MNRKLDEIVKYITMSDEYKKCIELKRKMSRNDELVNLINDIKKVQKEYVRSNFDEGFKNKLSLLEGRLNEIPIYVSYMQSLDIVNEMICYVKDELNQYFFELFNSDFE